MDVEEIIKMYEEGYSIEYIVKRYYNFRNSKYQQNYFNSSGDLIITKKFKKARGI